MKLHFGAFNRSVDGWVNTDITPHIWISKIPFLPFILFNVNLMSAERYLEHKEKRFSQLKYLDLTKPLFYPSDSVGVIFSSHVLEHLFMDEVEKLMLEMYRVLKPGGVCRIVVPDLEKIVALYRPEDPREFLTDMFEVSSRGAVKNQHHSGFTGKLLTKLATEAGFTICSVEKYQTGKCPDLDKLDNRPESLFFEAIK